MHICSDISVYRHEYSAGRDKEEKEENDEWD